MLTNFIIDTKFKDIISTEELEYLTGRWGLLKNKEIGIGLK